MAYLPFILNLIILVGGVYLIGLVLIQRGKGGGLAGAFGGAGGSSAFGSRAGDQFTKVTLVSAAIWLLLIMLMVKVMPRVPHSPNQAPVSQPVPADDQPPAGQL
ncbi:MAG TPA: preprotein translocase subunit SecG [Gemmataceae bacterium]|nr:preprotein translocase subunit SecG [Gemmataceae bacterium]